MPLEYPGASYFDAILGGMGFTPAQHGRFQGAAGKQYVRSLPIAQAAADYRQMRQSIPGVSYDMRFYDMDASGRMIRNATPEDGEAFVQSGGGAGEAYSPTMINNQFVGGGLAAPQSSGGGTMISNPFVQSSPDFSVQQSIAQASAASNDPDYQNNLARALYASKIGRAHV